jgi:glycine dehydrogenase subunit 2
MSTPNKAASGIALREDTIFERSASGRIGFELPQTSVPLKKPTSKGRQKAAELPEVSELQVVRHFTRLSSWNYAIDLGTFPLGSCTMKYNPRINEELAALPGFCDVHPELPVAFCQGSLKLIYLLERALASIVGLDACTVQPAAGAVGEFTGLSLIRAFHEKHGGHRKYVLIPDSAHGTNPASCILAGYEAIPLKVGKDGFMTVELVEEAISKYGRDIAALMTTNPNTLGVFEQNISQIAELLHGIGAQLCMDGANMNAILGIAKPGDMGVDVMQYNLHKTFSTPHGGGGPGSGPVACRSHLAPFLPNPRVVERNGVYQVEHLPDSIGKVKGAFGNFGVMVRALAYIMNHGSSGLRRVSTNAVINANYLRARLQKHYRLGTNTPHFHECVLSDSKQIEDNGVKTIQIAKALMDYGYHPPTVYFPLTVPGAMLIEPTETESLQELDELADAFLDIAKKIESKEETFEKSPIKTFVGKVDEVGAARKPILSLDDRTL